MNLTINQFNSKVNLLPCGIDIVVKGHICNLIKCGYDIISSGAKHNFFLQKIYIMPHTEIAPNDSNSNYNHYIQHVEKKIIHLYRGGE